MTVSNYSDRRPGDPEVMVELVVESEYTAIGFVDARHQRDGVWGAYVDYSYIAANGHPSHRRDWFPWGDLTVLTIDDVPPGGCVIPLRPGG